jgi:hypothetical protein
VDAGSVPSGILRHHFENQFADLFGYRPYADLFAHPGDEPPIELKARTVPAHHGIGRNDNQSVLPGRPKAAEEYPEELVDNGKSGTGVAALEHCQLLSQSEIFNQQNLARSKQPNQDASPKT